MSIQALFGLSILMSFVASGLGAAFFIPTVFVPAALITHGLIFWLLLRPDISR